MKLDLPALIRASNRRTPLVVDMPTPSYSMERELAKIYLDVLSVWTKNTVSDLIAEYEQGLQVRDSVETVLESVDQRTLQATLTFRKKWKAWADRGVRWHFKTLITKLKYATKLKLDDVISPSVTDGDTVNDLLEWNVSLIRNITADSRNKIASIVYSGLTSRTPATQVARQIREATGMSTARAKRIASDQTVKLSSALDASRLKDLGCDGYEWMHSGKTHFRPEHKARNKKYIKFGSEIDKTDPPGHAPFCGCKRRMVLNPPED